MSAAAAAISCLRCGDDSRWFLHHVYHLGKYKRLCTNCVLHLHPDSFCPICFYVHESPKTLTSNVVVTCARCHSSSHITCFYSPPDSPYMCPLCINPNSSLLVLRDFNGAKEMDIKAARVLLAAAKIAAGSMSKAVVAANVEAVLKTKEEVHSRNEATEALKRLDDLTAKQNLESVANRRVIGNNVADRRKYPSAVLRALDGMELRKKEIMMADRMLDGNVVLNESQQLRSSPTDHVKENVGSRQ